MPTNADISSLQKGGAFPQHITGAIPFNMNPVTDDEAERKDLVREMLRMQEPTGCALNPDQYELIKQIDEKKQAYYIALVS